MSFRLIFMTFYLTRLGSSIVSVLRGADSQQIYCHVFVSVIVNILQKYTEKLILWTQEFPFCNQFQMNNWKNSNERGKNVLLPVFEPGTPG